jgi:membrane protein DedA with SNARE-associated domain
VIAGIGWALGSSYEQFNHDFRYVELLVILAIVAGAAYLLLRWRRKATMGAP